MSDTNTEQTNTEPVPGTSQTEPTNHDFKNTPAYQSMAKQLAEYKQRESDRLAAEESAKKEAELKQLESQGKYEEAIKQRDAELERIKNEHQRDIFQRDLRSELYKAGLTNDLIIAGAIASYKDGDIAEYVSGIVSANQDLIAGKQVPPPPAPPGSVSVTGSVKATFKTADEYRAGLKSTDPEIRKAARDYGADYFNRHKHMPT